VPGETKLTKWLDPPIGFSEHDAPNAVARECPLKQCLGPNCDANGEALLPNIGLRRHVRSRREPHTLNRSRIAYGARGMGA